jgi:hypothetical protein
MMHWQIVASLLAWHVGVDPFNQPNVEAAKKNVFTLLDGHVSWTDRGEDVDAARASLHDARYIVLQAYAPLDSAHALSRLRDRAQAVFGVTTANLGPRYLHSTGQLHKGGPLSVAGVQIVVRPTSAPVTVAGQNYTFHDLHLAQAQGDYEAMRDAGRPVYQFIVDDYDEAASRLGL